MRSTKRFAVVLALSLLAVADRAVFAQSGRVTAPGLLTEGVIDHRPGGLPTYVFVVGDQMFSSEAPVNGLAFPLKPYQRFAVECRLLLRAGPDENGQTHNDVATGIYAHLGTPNGPSPEFADISYTSLQYGTTGGFAHLEGFIENGAVPTSTQLYLQSFRGSQAPVKVRKRSWCRFSPY